MFNSKLTRLISSFLLALLLYSNCFAQTSFYYVVPITGDGVSTSTAYRASISDLSGVTISAIIASNVNGSLKNNWAIVVATAIDHTAIQATTGVNKIPVTTLNATIGGAARTAITNALTNHGISASVMDSVVTWKDLILALGKLHFANFVITDLPTIPGL